MALRDTLLPIIDQIRTIPHSLGIRQWRVYLVVRTSSGPRTGQGTVTEVSTELVLPNGARPKVREIRSSDVVASGGVIASATYEIGPLTPEYAGGGLADTLFDPATTSTGREVLFRITGPNLPSAGVLCKRVEDDTIKPFSMKLRVQRIGR